MNEWRVEEFTRKLDLDSVRLVTPDGFEFQVYSPLGCIELLMALSLRDTELSFGGSRLHIQESGELTLVDTDKWMNPNFEYGQTITKAHVLAFVLGNYVLGKLNGRGT